MNKGSVCRVLCSEAKLLIKQYIEARKKFRQTIINKSLENFGKAGKNRYRSIVVNVLRITSFKDRCDFSNLQIQWNRAGAKRIYRLKDER